MAVFRFIYSPAIGTVPGAVATGSVAPGRYRSRYRTGGHFHVSPCRLGLNDPPAPAGAIRLNIICLDTDGFKPTAKFERRRAWREDLSSYLKSLIKTTFVAHNPRTQARYLPSRDQLNPKMLSVSNSVQFSQSPHNLRAHVQVVCHLSNHLGALVRSRTDRERDRAYFPPSERFE